MKKICKIPIGYIAFCVIGVLTVLMYKFLRQGFIKCSILFSILAILFIFYTIIRTYRISGNKIDVGKNERIEFIIICVLIILLSMFYIIYLKSEKNIKTWDNSAYWVQNIEFGGEYNRSLIDMLKATINSINNDEYNLFPSLLLNSIFAFSDKTFLSYVMSIYILFMIPTLLLYYMLIKKTLFRYEFHRNKIIITIAAFLPFIISPMLHFPTITGYLDVIGLIFVLEILNLLIDYDFKKLQIERIILLVISTTLLIISRRYFLFYILGIYSSYAIVNIIHAIYKKEYKKIKNILVIFSITTILVITMIMLVFAPMVIRVIKSNISELYVGYKNGGFIYQLVDITKRFSLIVITLSIIGYILSIINKNTRDYSSVMILTLLITTYLFSRIQSMGNHHMYLVIVFIIYGISMLIINVYYYIHKKICLNTIVLATCFLIATNFTISFGTVSIAPYFSDNILRPTIRDDYEELLNIRKEIDNIVTLEKNEDSAKIYVIAASGNYNSETFQNIYYPNIESGKIFVIPSNVDLTHGFRTSFYESNYYLTVTPIQYHLKPEYEQCVTILYNAIECESPLNDNLELIKEWNSIDSIQIKLYKKIAEFTKEDKQYLADEFNISYSDYPELFYDRIMQ